MTDSLKFCFNPLSLLGASSREHELMEALQVLLERLNSGKIPLSPEMLEQAGLASASGGRSATGGAGRAV